MVIWHWHLVAAKSQVESVLGLVIETTASTISEVSREPKLSKTSQQRQKKIDQQASKISSLEAQNWKLTQLLQPKFLVDTITQAVASSLNISGSNKLQQK